MLWVIPHFLGTTKIICLANRIQSVVYLWFSNFSWIISQMDRKVWKTLIWIAPNEIWGIRSFMGNNSVGVEFHAFRRLIYKTRGDSNWIKSIILTSIQPRCGCFTLSIPTRGFHPGLFKFNPVGIWRLVK